MWQTTLSFPKLDIMPLRKCYSSKERHGPCCLESWRGIYRKEIAKEVCDEVNCMLGVGSWIVKLTLFSACLAWMVR